MITIPYTIIDYILTIIIGICIGYTIPKKNKMRND
jgi:hypothetical protein